MHNMKEYQWPTDWQSGTIRFKGRFTISKPQYALLSITCQVALLYFRMWSIELVGLVVISQTCYWKVPGRYLGHIISHYKVILSTSTKILGQHIYQDTSATFQILSHSQIIIIRLCNTVQSELLTVAQLLLTSSQFQALEVTQEKNCKPQTRMLNILSLF